MFSTMQLNNKLTEFVLKFQAQISALPLYIIIWRKIIGGGIHLGNDNVGITRQPKH